MRRPLPCRVRSPVPAPKGELVFAFGDSHTFCPISTGLFRRAYVGPITLNRLGRPGEASSLLSSQVGLVQDDILVIAGEIDVRCHVRPQTEAGRTLDDVLDGLGDSALNCVGELSSAFDVDVVFCAVIPPGEGEESHDFPYRGTIAERSRWTTQLNAIISEKLTWAGFQVFDPYVNFRDAGGALQVAYKDASVHLMPEHGHAAFGPLVEAIRR